MTALCGQCAEILSREQVTKSKILEWDFLSRFLRMNNWEGLFLQLVLYQNCHPQSTFSSTKFPLLLNFTSWEKQWRYVNPVHLFSSVSHTEAVRLFQLIEFPVYYKKPKYLQNGVLLLFTTHAVAFCCEIFWHLPTKVSADYFLGKCLKSMKFTDHVQREYEWNSGFLERP